MNRFVFCLLFFWVAAADARALPAEADQQEPERPANAYDVPSFRTELQRISARLQKDAGPEKMAELCDSLPKSWNVTAREHTYSVSTQSLRNFLTERNSKKAREWVDLLDAETRSDASAQSAASPTARAELAKILARREFGAVHAPSAWELSRQRIGAWFQRLLLRLFGGMARYPIAGKVIFWLAIAGSVLWLAVWLLRFWSRSDRVQALHRSGPMFPGRTWQEWLRAAREAAAKGDFREAVHACYWAGIVRLEDTGAVPKDRTKTPREYLRLASNPAPGELTGRASLREPLSILTSRLERTWYANRGAGAEDFQDSLRQLEALGCPLE